MSQSRRSRVLSWTGLSLAAVLVAPPVFAAGALTVRINAPYNVIVDSNVCSPSTYAPQIATIGASFCNTGDAPLTDVVGYIGNYTARTPGTYPVRDSAAAANDVAVTSSCLANTGTYSLTHLGGSVDATRYIGTLDVGQCAWQYWSFTYPRRSNPDTCGSPVWCASNNPNDDLWLPFDVWGSSGQGSASNATWRVTMRNEISANANKIFPNGASWFNEPTTCYPGQTVVTNGVNYQLGNVNFGFDNDGNGSPDYNAWLQPIGDTNWNPSCFRLVKTSGQLQINVSGGGGTQYYDFVNQLYFTNLPSNNTAITGVVYYTFMCLDGACIVPLTPYQEAASGSDNEKFAGDYGTGVGSLQSVEPNATLGKTVADTSPLDGRASAGETLNYTVTLTNTESVDIGNPDLGVPLVIRDSIPAGTKYAGGTATSSFGCCGVTILYSTDNGVSWSSTQPGNPQLVTNLMWRLQSPVPAGASGTVGFGVTVNSPYSGNPVIVNTAAASFGDSSPFLQATAAIPVLGTARIGDTIFRDDGAGTPANANNGVQNAGETTIANVGLSLYWDVDGDGVLDSGEPLVATTTSGASGSGCGGTGNYCFTGIAAGNYVVVVDKNDADVPTGSRLTTPTPTLPKDTIAVTGLTAGATVATTDFGFGPSLLVAKTRTSAATSTEGQVVTYTLSATNARPASQPCSYTAWAERALGTSSFTTPGNAVGAQGPDGLYANGGEGGSGNNLNVDTFGIGNPGGTIASVTLQIPLYLSGVLTDDNLDYTVTDVVGGQSLSGTISTATLNTAVGAANLKTFTVNASSILTTFAEVAGATVQFVYKHTGSSDGVVLYVDAVGLQATTSDVCGAPSDDMRAVPMTDTYDADVLQFLDATLTPTGSSVTGTAPNRVGTLTWDLGPLRAQQTKTVTVRFLAAEQDTNGDGEADSVSHTNTESVAGAVFFDGGAVNTATATATHQVDPRGSISGYVWADLGTANGVKNVGEPGIPFVTVELLNGTCTAGSTCPTTVTDSTGFYSFGSLATGSYRVLVRTTTLPGAGPVQTGDPDQPGVTCTTCDNQNTVAKALTLTNGNAADDDFVNNNFGYVIGNVVFGTLWDDIDGDGVKDPGEAALSNITVDLTNGVCTIGTTCPRVTTDANGRYRFVNVANGSWAVAVLTSSLPALTAPQAWAQTGDPDQAGTTCTTCDNTKATFAVSGGNIFGAYDFGYRRTGTSSIGDTLYADWNGNGSQGSGEEGIANVTITLINDVNGDGVRNCGTDTICGNADDVDLVRAVTTTNASGGYSFTGLPAGNWIVLVDEGDPDFVAAYTKLSETQDPDQAGVCTTCDGKASVVTNGTAGVTTTDFGYRPIGFGSIGDRVWNDANGNGLQDGTETGLVNVTITLYEDNNGNGVIDAADAVVGTATTDTSGAYAFYNLPVGRYLVDVDQTDAQIPTDAYGNRYILSGGTDPLLVTLVANQQYTAADFGFGPGATLGDRVFRDDNGDGNQAGTEPGINSVTVNLYRDNDGNKVFSAGDTLVATTVTATVNGNAGSYQFTGLTPGNYVVRVDSADVDLPSTNFTADPDTPLDGQYGVTLSAAQDVVFADFGVQPPNVLGDRVWNDQDGDGVQDAGEPGIAGVVVSLYSRAIGSTGAYSLVTSVTTDSDGNFTFGNLSAAQYRIDMSTATALNGYTQTYEKDAGVCGACNKQSDVTINPSLTDLTYDFGFRLPAKLEIDKDTTTPTVNPGGQVIYTIKVRNVGDASATLVRISDVLMPEGATCPTCFSYVSSSIAQDAGVVRTTTVNPTAGNTSLTWGNWTLPANAAVTITYTVNVPAGMAAGTYENTATATFDSNSSGTNDAGDTVVDDTGNTAQDADTPTGQDPETDEDVTVSAVAATISKTATFVTDANSNGLVDPGDVLQYSMTVTNSGTATLTSVSLSDAVPTGTTYVAGTSTIVSYRTDTITTYADDFDNGSGGTNYPSGTDGTVTWTTTWSGSNTRVVDLGDYSVQIGKNDSASRAVDLSGFYRATLRFNVRRVAIDSGDTLSIAVGASTLGTLDGLGMTGSACTNPGGIAADQTDAAYVAVTCTISTFTNGQAVAFSGATGLANGESFYIDDVVVERAVRASAGPTAGDDPSTLVLASRGLSLLAGESMNVTFRVTADNPLPVGITQIANTAYASATQLASPISASANKGIANLPTASISGTIWDDTDGDGTIDAGEPKLSGVRVELWTDPNGDGDPADGTRVVTALTPATGAYTFSAIAAGNYVVVVADDTLPVSYVQTGDPDEAGTCTVCNGRSAAVSTGSNTISNKNFGYQYSPTPLPVTLSSFHAEPGTNGKLAFTWTTDTETNNVGFYLFGLVDDEWVPLHKHLIRTKNGNSVAPLTYRYEADAVEAHAFLVVDVDNKGVEHVHGPFPLGQWEVSQPAAMQAIPWAAIRQEHQAKVDLRQGAWKKKDLPSVRLVVTVDGLYRVTYEDLKAAGIDMAKVPLSQLALFDRNGAVPMYVDGNGSFGPGKAIEFYGRAADSLYGDRNHYTLRVDPGAVLRATDDNTPASQLRNPVTVYRETVKTEQQSLYNPAAPGRDPWYDQDLMAIFSPGTANVSLTVTDPVVDAGPARLGVDLWGLTDWPGKDPDHHVVVSLNGTEVTDLQFNGTADGPVDVEIPSGVLTAGANRIDVDLPLDLGVDWDIVGLNTYSITYPRRLLAVDGRLSFHGDAGDKAQAFTVGNLPTSDVSVYRLSANKLERIAKPSVTGTPGSFSVTFAGAARAADYVLATAAKKLKPQILAAPPKEDIATGSAEYLVIAHPDFIQGVQPLADHRRAQGKTVQVVDVEQIYENLSNGMVDPEAIHQYIAYAAKEKGTKYVVLVGGDTYDYKNYLGTGGFSFIPSLYVQAGGVNFVPADPLLGDVDRDSIPDVPVGRLPVRTNAELSAVIAKTLAYEAKNYGRTFLSATDAYDPYERISFAQVSTQLLNGLGAGWSVEHADIDELGVPVARAKVINTLNSGVAFAQYFGHSSYNVWSFSILFASPHAIQLQNVGRPAVVAQWGCWNNYYVHPTINTLGHALMVSGEQGAAAVLGATALTDSKSDIELGQRYLPRIVQPGATIGDALLAAKRDLAQQHPEMRDVIVGWTILGDPALVVEPNQP